MTMPVPVTLSTEMLCDATRGRVTSGPAHRTFEGVSTDSRRVVPRSLFVALKGERFDAHAFVGDAIAAGASGAVVSDAAGAFVGATIIQVDDTLRALQAIARAIRRASQTRVIAITGSAGKTTTKEVMADLLALRYRVHRNEGNLNNHIGLPLSLVELRHGPDMAVVELGMNHAGEIRTLVGIAEPDVRVWTNVGDAHIGAFGSREAIAEAKAEILEGASASTLVVANADDPLVTAHVSRARGRRLTFGESASADVRATSVDDGGFDGTTASVDTPSGSLQLTIQLPGRAHLMNVLAAVAVAVDERVPLEGIAAAVAAIRPVARRGTSIVSPRGVRVVDDSYNASPAAVEATLATLSRTSTRGRRVAVLGEMRELGDRSTDLHAACGRAAARASVDLLVAIGGVDADTLAAGALAAGLDPRHVVRFPTSEAAAESIVDLVRPRDLVVVKGSRSTRTDLVADRLLEVA
jgi:UDP-N-acetylmuramoyl-tripeptide--D-alanyl-D-alanine ligase